MEGKFRYIPTFCSKVCRILRYPLVNKTHSRIHFILEHKLNIVRILKDLCRLNWGNHVYSVSSAKIAPLVLGAGRGTREAESRASLEMGHESCRVPVSFRTPRHGGSPWDEVRLRKGGLRTGAPAILSKTQTEKGIRN